MAGAPATSKAATNPIEDSHFADFVPPVVCSACAVNLGPHHANVNADRPHAVPSALSLSAFSSASSMPPTR